MNWFDVHIVLFLNHFANHWRWFDGTVAHAYSTNLIGGAGTMAIAWYALFDPKEKDQLRQRNELLLTTLLLCVVAIMVARALALGLPFRSRPVWTPALNFQLPHASQPVLLGWSSFPSDHAALFYTLATGIFFVSRPLGWLAFSWVVAVISFPALYLGVHWPTDVIVGACLGVVFAQLAKVPRLRESVQQFTARWYRQQPGLFFAALFLWSYEIANLFEDARRLGRALWHLI